MRKRQKKKEFKKRGEWIRMWMYGGRTPEPSNLQSYVEHDETLTAEKFNKFLMEILGLKNNIQLHT